MSKEAIIRFPPLLEEAPRIYLKELVMEGVE
jgi:hypothetical protein